MFHIRNPKISVDRTGWPPNMCITIQICPQNRSTARLYPQTASSRTGHRSSNGSANHAFRRVADANIRLIINSRPGSVHHALASSRKNECSNPLSPCRSSMRNHEIHSNVSSIGGASSSSSSFFFFFFCDVPSFAGPTCFSWSVIINTANVFRASPTRLCNMSDNWPMPNRTRPPWMI
jgi:hypothetical protein